MDDIQMQEEEDSEGCIDYGPQDFDQADAVEEGSESPTGDNAASAEALEPAVSTTGPRAFHLMQILDDKLPSKFEFLQDPKDAVLSDTINIMENFERIFVAYINDNYRSFTESDLQRLIKDELK